MTTAMASRSPKKAAGARFTAAAASSWRLRFICLITGIAMTEFYCIPGTCPPPYFTLSELSRIRDEFPSKVCEMSPMLPIDDCAEVPQSAFFKTSSLTEAQDSIRSRYPRVDGMFEDVFPLYYGKKRLILAEQSEYGPINEISLFNVAKIVVNDIDPTNFIRLNGLKQFLKERNCGLHLDKPPSMLRPQTGSSKAKRQKIQLSTFEREQADERNCGLHLDKPPSMLRLQTAPSKDFKQWIQLSISEGRQADEQIFNIDISFYPTFDPKDIEYDSSMDYHGKFRLKENKLLPISEIIDSSTRKHEQLITKDLPVSFKIIHQTRRIYSKTGSRLQTETDWMLTSQKRMPDGKPQTFITNSTLTTWDKWTVPDDPNEKTYHIKRTIEGRHALIDDNGELYQRKLFIKIDSSPSIMAARKAIMERSVELGENRIFRAIDLHIGEPENDIGKAASVIHIFDDRDQKKYPVFSLKLSPAHPFSYVVERKLRFDRHTLETKLHVSALVKKNVWQMFVRTLKYWDNTSIDGPSEVWNFTIDYTPKYFATLAPRLPVLEVKDDETDEAGQQLMDKDSGVGMAGADDFKANRIFKELVSGGLFFFGLLAIFTLCSAILRKSRVAH